jgi:GT2 family glycosyltransferase
LIIPTYQREQVLCDTLRAALDQTFEGYEIVVVDQTGSHTPRTARFLSELPGRVQIINQQPPSLAAARNRGICEARGEILIMIDDDVIIGPRFISHHAEPYADPDVVAVAGRVTQDRRFVTRAGGLGMSPFVHWMGYTAFDELAAGETCRLTGGNCSFRRQAALEIGLFDESFIGSAWGEDYDFSLRLARTGRIVYSPDASLHHLNTPEGGCRSRSRFSAETIYSKAHNLAYLLEKHGQGWRDLPPALWYVYRQLLIKKDYLTPRGLAFVAYGHLPLVRGLLDGRKLGRQRARQRSPG